MHRRHTHSLRSLITAAGLVAVAGVAACAVSADRTEQTAAAAQEQQAAEADRHAQARDRGHHHRGPIRAIFEVAAEHGDLTAEQAQTLQAIRDDLEADGEAKATTKEQLRAAAIEIVRTGDAESEQFDRAIEQAAAAIEQRVKERAGALEELHAILDSDQRSAVAAGLRERIEERFGQQAEHPHHRKGFKKLATYLVLTPLQLDKLKALKKQLVPPEKRLRPTREELTALVDAFEGDDFDEALAAFHADKAVILRKRLAEAGDHTDTVLSLLSDGQRDLLAELIERGPQAVMPPEER